MRKVTASAVILTALTGCSQSSIPSTQWSFEVPTDDQATSATEAMLAADRSLSVMSEETQSFVGQPAGRSVGGRVMGPAFEQPATEVTAETSISTVGRPGSKEVSTLAAEAYGVTSGLVTQPSTRPDPVAQVRAYLRSSGSPSALTNRTPYSSGVYLSSLPTPNRYYEPSIASLDTAFPIGTSGLGLTEVLPASFSTGATTISTVSGSDAFSAPAELVMSEPPLIADAAPSVSTAFTSDASGETDFAERLNAQLPQLEADLPEADVASDIAPINYADNYIVRSPELSRAENVPAASIGTAILQGLQNQDLQNQDLQNQEAASVTIQVEDEGLPSLVGDGTALESEQFATSLPVSSSQTIQSQYFEAQPFPYGSEAVPVTDTRYDSSTTEGVVANAADGNRSEGDYAYAPTGEAQAVPSLSRLTETMPARDISPLINSFRSSSTLSPTSESSVLGDAPDSEADFEPVSNAVTNTDATAITAPIMESTFAEPTIYVPIAEDPERTSSILLQNAADTLAPEVSTADLISDLAAREAFSSILTSSAFTGDDESLITLTSLRHQEEKRKVKQSHRKMAHRSDAITLAAKKISMRRQRLTWM